MADPLAPYRKKPLENAEIAIKPKASERYSAFAAKDRVERLRIRRVMGPTRSPRYLHLQDMGYDGDFGTNFVLDFDFMLVLVRGKNLQAVVSAIETSTADFIQEYHPDLWPKPADGEPVIEMIEVVMREGGGDETEKPASKQH
jgi:hypothetical protein